MGVPSLFAFFFKKYNKCMRYAKIPKDSDEQPNGHFDKFELVSYVTFEWLFLSLYLDFNGIMHACSHPTAKLFPPSSEAEMFEEMMIFIDHLLNIVRPTKLLYIAIGILSFLFQYTYFSFRWCCTKS